MSEDTLVQPPPINTTSSRNLIPVVHEPQVKISSRSPINYGPAKPSYSPAKSGNSYQEIYRREQQNGIREQLNGARDQLSGAQGRSPARDGMIRTVTAKSPVRTVSPARISTPYESIDSRPLPYVLTHPSKHSYQNTQPHSYQAPTMQTPLTQPSYFRESQ